MNENHDGGVVVANARELPDKEITRYASEPMRLEDVASFDLYLPTIARNIEAIRIHLVMLAAALAGRNKLLRDLKTIGIDKWCDTQSVIDVVGSVKPLAIEAALSQALDGRISRRMKSLGEQNAPANRQVPCVNFHR